MKESRGILEDGNRELGKGNPVTLNFKGLTQEFTEPDTLVYIIGRPDAVSAYVPEEFGFKDRGADRVLLSEPQPVGIGRKSIQLRKFNMPEFDFGMAYEWLLNTFGMEKPDIQERAPEQGKPVRNEKKESKGRFITDLTQEAKEGRLPMIIGREGIIDNSLLIMSRKDKQNPILIGKPGVGKNTIVKAIAQRVASGDVPDGLPIKRIMKVDLGSMITDSGMKGDDDKRYKELMDFARGDEIMIFMDDIHLLAGERISLPFTEMLRASIIKGEVRVIGTTTSVEYREIEAYPALERRLSKIVVEETTHEETMEILQGIRADYEAYHGVTIEDQALESIIPVAQRSMPNRCFPDKAIEILDTSLALCRTYRHPVATKADVMEAVEKLIGIPAQKLGVDSARMSVLDEYLSVRIIGQAEAIAAVTNALKVKHAGLTNGKPPAFLFTGPTGVGKTETARLLAEFFFGSPDNIIRIDMSEYMERHTVSTLIGAPRGYVGYEQGGTLTEAVKNMPYSIILMDEFEKAHPDVTNIMLQIADDGRLTDTAGTAVNFRETIIVLTSNVPQDQLKRCFRPELLGRLRIVQFRRLERHDICVIAHNELEKLRGMLDEKDMSLEYDDQVILHIADGLDPDYGARGLKQEIEVKIIQPLANLMLESDYRSVTLSEDNGRIAITGERREET